MVGDETLGRPSGFPIRNKAIFVHVFVRGLGHRVRLVSPYAPGSERGSPFIVCMRGSAVRCISESRGYSRLHESLRVPLIKD